MRSLLVIIDGLGDDPIPEWNGLTPFQYAEHKNMDELIRIGAYSEVSICEDDFIPESLSCILRLLGVQRQDFRLTERIWNYWRMTVIFLSMRWYCAATWFQ